MKKIIMLLLTILMCVSLAACSGYSTYEGNKDYIRDTGFIEIAGEKNLYYDPATKIVYVMFNEASGYKGYGYMSAYYAPNGLPYTYDVETQTLVEID